MFIGFLLLREPTKTMVTASLRHTSSNQMHLNMAKTFTTFTFPLWECESGETVTAVTKYTRPITLREKINYPIKIIGNITVMARHAHGTEFFKVI